MSTTLSNLPGELYEAIVNHIPQEDIQWTLLALTRALPSAPIPRRRLYEQIYIRRPQQAVPLYLSLRHKAGEEKNRAGEYVEVLHIHDWTVDADVVLNIVRLLPNLHTLSIWIGPSNFAPEHLEELFERPLAKLRYLSLRFRP